MSSTIPPWLLQGISSIRWSLDDDAHPPLHFKPLQEMRYIRQTTHFLPSCCSSDGTCPSLNDSSTFHDFCAHLPESFEQLLPQRDVDSRHFGLIAVSLILLGNGFTDEAHALVAPMSYPQELPFGYGPSSVYLRVSEEARSYATYVHGLVHRREGNNIGEYGMKGFDNASYWSSNVIRTPGVEALPSEELRQSVTVLASKTPYSSCPPVQEWVHSHGFGDSPSVDPCFEARNVHALCATVVNTSDCDPVLQEFAEQLVEMEVRILLLHALQRSGVTVETAQILRTSLSLDAS